MPDPSKILICKLMINLKCSEAVTGGVIFQSSPEKNSQNSRKKAILSGSLF